MSINFFVVLFYSFSFLVCFYFVFCIIIITIFFFSNPAAAVRGVQCLWGETVAECSSLL